jgi:glyoxylase-like metal-dependent hydrolase (beta-lactamase superfamily II)
MTTNQAIVAMTAKQLTRMIVNKEQLFILDVRNAADYNDWKVEGYSIQTINIPYFELLDGIDEAIKQLAESKKVLVVCAKEGSSQFVAQQLVDTGRTDVYYLQGGMKAWSEYMEPVKIGDLNDGGSIYQFVRMGKGCLSYMIVSNGEAVVVDALRMMDAYIQFAINNNVSIKHTIDTHLHADHISGGRRLALETGAAYWLPSKDATEVVFDYNALEEGDQIVVGATAITIQPVYSPGHTIGSTSLIAGGKYLLSGDSLFITSIGRPDLAGKAEDWVHDLRTTLYKKYRSLSEHLVVLPAHFGKYTELGEAGQVSARLGDLFVSNPGLNIKDEDAFRQAVTGNLPELPNAYKEIRQINMGRMLPSAEEQRDMEIGPNRCAIHEN